MRNVPGFLQKATKENERAMQHLFTMHPSNLSQGEQCCIEGRINTALKKGRKQRISFLNE